jgi:adenine-specific DNA-methyltransferase
LRYIGHKRKLLAFIGEAIDRLGVRPGRALDAFAGTATVGRALKARGFAVTTCDLMRFSYVFQRAYVVADAYPDFRGIASDPELHAARRQREFAALVDERDELRVAGQRPLHEVCVFLDHYLEARTSFITTNFAAPADADARSTARRYFTTTNAQRIDAIRHRIDEWRQGGALTSDEEYILLAALIEGADAVANTAGVYAAWIKTWQGNAQHPFRMRPAPLVPGTGLACHAHEGDVNALAPELSHFDLLYLDPPYNARQYNAYYHIPEMLARGWFDTVPVIRGKTGLPSDAERKSAWSSPRRCVDAFAELIARIDADHVLLSYNSDGLIPETAIEEILVAAGRPGTYRRIARPYRRYRSDQTSVTRQYRTDALEECLYSVRLRPRAERATAPLLRPSPASAARCGTRRVADRPA